MTRRALILLLALAGCATERRPLEKQPFFASGPGAADAAAKAPATAAAANGAAANGATAAPARAAPETDLATVDPVEYAKRHKRPDECEAAARRVKAVSPDRGWAVLRACVARTKFTLLDRLLTEEWSNDLRTRNDAGVVLAKVIALRGGDAAGDLGQLRQNRIPLFAIATAVGHPELYRNRLVLFRAEVRDLRLPTKSASGTAKLSEFAMGSTVAGTRAKSSSSGGGKGGYDSTGKYDANGEHDSLGRRVSKDISYGSNVITQNVAIETGLEVIARFSTADPFFEPGRQFIVLGRFDGVRQVPSEDEMSSTSSVPVISLLAYFEPSAAIVE